MQQVVQNVRNGQTMVVTVPDPVCGRAEVLVANAASVVSAGTERYVVELAKKSLLGKARARPDQVRRVLQKVKSEGVLATFQQVTAKLNEPMPLGYATAGVVLGSGASAHEYRPGDRVATAGPHAGIVAIGKHLCARIPDGVTFEQAAYSTLGAIALEGVRLTRTTLGERVLVIGAGLLGIIAVGLLKAQGCRVFVTDLDPARLELARAFGADAISTGAPLDDILGFTDGAGVDAVVITAATASNGPIELAAAACRPRGRVVLVGVVGLDLPRDPFFKKELEFTVSASLGPGRWDPVYEERGVDYPIGHVRWTAQRNMQAVLDLIAQGKLPVEKLTSHRFDVSRAAEAYELVAFPKEPSLGIVLEYPETPRLATRNLVGHKAARATGDIGVSVVGAGNFGRLVLLPELKRLDVTLRGLCSARGLTATQTAESMGFAFSTSEIDRIVSDEATKAVFVLTRHDLHADLVTRCLAAGKHVFVEKPLCIHASELDAIRRTVEDLGDRCPVLSVGFNRRFTKGVRSLREFFGKRARLSIHFRFVTAQIPKEVWVHDPAIGGGRLVGEACHAIDTVIAIAGSPVVKVYAESVPTGTPETDDRVILTMRHENGTVSTVHYDAAGDRAGPKERIEVFGEGKSGFLDDFAKLELWKGGERVSGASDRDMGFASELRELMKVVRYGGAWPIPWEELASGSWAALAALESLSSGAAIARIDDG